MPDRLPLTDLDLQHFLSIDGFTPVRIAKMYGLTVPKVEKQIARLERDKAKEAERLARQMTRAMTGRPMPPDWMCEAWDGEDAAQPPLTPALNLMEWAQATFIDEGGLLCNPDHAHLTQARIGILWSGVGLKKQGRVVAGQMVVPKAQGDRWAKARHGWLMGHWFGVVPDFLMTLSAAHCAQADDASFCSLVEHEYYHADQAKDEFGSPKFTDEGEPMLVLVGHTAEEHQGVVQRYGVGAAAGGVAELVAAASRPPSIAPALIAQACGTCP